MTAADRAVAEVRAEWQRRVVAEYRSAAITHSLLGWLLRLGASPTLLHEATRIVDDAAKMGERVSIPPRSTRTPPSVR